MTNETNKPVKKFMAGGVSAALWKNSTTFGDGRQGESLSLTLERRYKDKDGNWKSSGSLKLNDIPKASLVLNQAYEFMLTKNSEDSPEAVEEEVVA